MNKKISKRKNVEVAFINVSLYPTEKQKPEEYVKLLSSIMGSRVMIQSSTSDRSTLLREFDKYGDHYHGFFCNAIFPKPDSKMLDVKKNVLEKSDVDPNKGLSRSAGLPPLSPSRTVHATFTAHGSCNSVNYFSF